MIRLARSLPVALCLLAFTTSAHADCAWLLLWNSRGTWKPIHAWPTQQPFIWSSGWSALLTS
jgi:hypothetical protein